MNITVTTKFLCEIDSKESQIKLHDFMRDFDNQNFMFNFFRELGRFNSQ